jgi:hypothetical protein
MRHPASGMQQVIGNRQSAIDNRQSAIGNEQHAIDKQKAKCHSNWIKLELRKRRPICYKEEDRSGSDDDGGEDCSSSKPPKFKIHPVTRRKHTALPGIAVHPKEVHLMSNAQENDEAKAPHRSQSPFIANPFNVIQ